MDQFKDYILEKNAEQDRLNYRIMQVQWVRKNCLMTRYWSPDPLIEHNETYCDDGVFLRWANRNRDIMDNSAGGRNHDPSDGLNSLDPVYRKITEVLKEAERKTDPWISAELNDHGYKLKNIIERREMKEKEYNYLLETPLEELLMSWAEKVKRSA